MIILFHKLYVQVFKSIIFSFSNIKIPLLRFLACVWSRNEKIDFSKIDFD